MELDDLSSRKSTLPLERPENASEYPVQREGKTGRTGRTVEPAVGEDVLAENPESRRDEILQDLHSSEPLPSTPPNIITSPRNTHNPILLFIIFLSPQKWWSRHISLVVAHTSDSPTGGDPRDYLSLERTFLAYIRTASALVSVGVITTQLFVLKKVNPRTGSVLGAIISAGGRGDVDWMFQVFQAAEVSDTWQGNFCRMGYCIFVDVTFCDFLFYFYCFAGSELRQLLRSALLWNARFTSLSSARGAFHWSYAWMRL